MFNTYDLYKKTTDVELENNDRAIRETESVQEEQGDIESKQVGVVFLNPIELPLTFPM